MNTLETLASQAPFGNGRVHLGFGMDEFSPSKESNLAVFDKVKSLGINVITSHYARGPLQGKYPCASIEWSGLS